MVRRLAVGSVKGLVLGSALAAALVAGLGLVRFGPWLWAPAACGTGLLTGLVVGKPLWAGGAKVEAGLKGLAGALLAAGGLFALRTWLPLSLDLSALDAGQGAIGDLPAVSLPLLASVLGAWFEADNTASSPAAPERRRVEVTADPSEASTHDSEAAADPSRRQHDHAARPE